MPPFLTWCPDCGNELRDVGWKECPHCNDEYCLRCIKEHKKYCKESEDEE